MQLTLFNQATTSSSPPLDQYYTKDKIAQLCIERTIDILKNFINIKRYLFFEPSAGYGCFYDELTLKKIKVIAFDINPKHNRVKELDFLDNDDLANILNKITNKKIIAIGNPPFGKKSKTAIDFFNQASKFSDIIAFILPNQFKKWSVHKNLNKNYQLIDEMNLPQNAFYTENKKDYHVRSIFQIWTNLKTNYSNKRIIKKPLITHRDFEMYQYNNTKEALPILNKEFDFAIFSQGYGDYKSFITNKKEFDIKKQYILFKCKNKQVINNLKSINFEKLSKENTTVPGFRKNNVVAEYIKKYNG